MEGIVSREAERQKRGKSCQGVYCPAVAVSLKFNSGGCQGEVVEWHFSDFDNLVKTPSLTFETVLPRDRFQPNRGPGPVPPVA